MAQIFHPSMNVVARSTIFGAAFILAFLAWTGGVLVRSDYVTGAHVVRDQPIPFSHQHHVSELGLDCRFCHHTAEQSTFAGMPSTELCMGCHSQVWKDSAVLKPLRDSFASGQAVQWNRVHNLPDFVYFNHSIHVAKGIGCESCHGRVDDMPLMRRVTTLHMEWCLHCHRHPGPEIRNREDIYRFGLKQQMPIAVSMKRVDLPEVPRDQLTNDSSASKRAAGIASDRLTALPSAVTKQLTDCVVCHR